MKKICVVSKRSPPTFYTSIRLAKLAYLRLLGAAYIFNDMPTPVSECLIFQNVL